MINSARIEYLLNKHHEGIISSSEYSELITALKENDNDAGFLQAMDVIWKNADAEHFHTDAEQENFYQKLTQSNAFKPKGILAKIKPFYRYAAAAVILISLAVSVYFYSNNQVDPYRFSANDIAPGGNKAMLLLSNGEKIDLTKVSNGELLHQAGISIAKTADGNLTYTVSGSDQKSGLENTIVTPKGGQYQVNLPDGTKVWLNAESSLKFPLQFKDGERVVSLIGEAYFEVAKKYRNGARLPFYVATANQRVEVLGTHFNVYAYPTDKNTKTTLLEGAVRVVSFGKQQISYLKPGEQAVNNGSDTKVNVVDTEEAMAWKNGLFIFNGQNLNEIMKEVERWYNVEVVFKDEALKKDVFNGSTSRFKNISELLEVLESTGSVHFKIEGRRVLVMD